ncbi:MAG TPA: dihydrodipicolinate synthase family protein [Candidatus Dormibacteraeota bacterium]|nr:dihydrodipicolinate synthase family protein [Candidatus Dormibacteraeota bacterium]
MEHPIAGALAASVTPLAADGAAIDEDAFGSLVDFLAGAGLDGLLAMGTTGEGILLSVAERRRAAELFVAAAAGRLRVVVHAGAQTTRDTVALAEHAATAGAAGVAVIGPPYFALDGRSLVDHFGAAARACAPLPFFVYEFAARSGYAVPPSVIEELRGRVDNLAGLKVSDTPWERFEPYFLEGLSVFVGSEGLIARAMERGAAGAVSALAAAVPELVVDAVRSRAPSASDRCRDVRDEIQRFPFHTSLKRLLARRGVRMTDGVRAPLRRLTGAEAAAFDAVAAGVLSGLPAGAR